MELSNPNQPILRRLMIEASGTYHHSIIVANLAEAAFARQEAARWAARAKQLEAALDVAAEVADDKELELTGTRDEF